MFEIKRTQQFDKWLSGLKDIKTRTCIFSRLDRLRVGNFGDVKTVGEGVLELRIHYGAGYRIYFKQTNKTIIFLLCGGDKSTQTKDIKAAKILAEGIDNDY
jgi:putative addiction module killer protein